MRGMTERWANMTLRQKLILAFACFIVVPFFIIGGTLSWLYVKSNQSMLLDAAIANNRQIVKNIDTSLNPLLQLSMLPVQNHTLFQIMQKDYESVSYPFYEKQQDFDTVGSIIRNSIMPYSELISSAIIYQSTNQLIIGRSNDDYMNHRYLENGFYNETYVREIIRNNGIYVPVGIHDEKLMSFKPAPVVSMGRAVIDPFTKETLGFILFNIGVERLQMLWSDIHFTDNTRFYLFDQNSNVIYSTNGTEIGKPAADVLGSSVQLVDGHSEQLQEDEDHYFISSDSSLTGWKTVTVMPKNELFGFVNTIVRTIAISLFILLGLSIVTSIYIATSITKPLLQLERRMKLVSQGNLDVSFEAGHGEIGRISVTIDRMLQEIRSLIRTIYHEEQEKRQMEILALQSQIRPHFMYNTLNAIKWMAKMQGAAGIEEALTAFSSVIRFTARTQTDYVTVREEIEFIKSYTKILDIRYFNKFDVTYDIDPGVWEYQILKFMLQPLVENAIFHGFDEIPYKGKLEIRIRQEAGHLVMTVADNGRGMSAEQSEALTQNEAGEHLNSIGLNNIRRRIELFFGPGYGLTIQSEENAGTTAVIVVPIIDQPNAGETK
ncbi:histidine kinase [Cohnella kolymensis]|uniref:Histidine kinase n=1 Tax=Cohnella kolymensis TaxID=1590652 RepID=A0ABR5A0P0_9BACL|nr:sensor histidine kinase [Cohnella kolymensis]KIL34203.1 histidine kinase [Cohnella kolymensis]